MFLSLLHGAVALLQQYRNPIFLKLEFIFHILYLIIFYYNLDFVEQIEIELNISLLFIFLQNFSEK